MSFLRYLKHLIFGFLGVFLGLRNLCRAFWKARRRGPFARMEASLDRITGTFFLAIGSLYLITACFFDNRKKAAEDVSDEDEDEEDEEA